MPLSFVQHSLGNSQTNSSTEKAKDLTEVAKSLILLVGLEGFEPSAN
jgi:hypothetical protein